jgi:hypothetical protein
VRNVAASSKIKDNVRASSVNARHDCALTLLTRNEILFYSCVCQVH